MNLLQKAKARLARMLDIRFESVQTDKGVLEYDGELEIGSEVFQTDEEGNLVTAPDGKYKTSDSLITVQDGIVEAMNPSRPMKAQKGTRKTFRKKFQEEDPQEGEGRPVAGAGEGESPSMEMFNELLAAVEELAGEVEALQAQMDGVEGDVTSIEEGFKKAMKMSLAVPAEEEIERSTKGRSLEERFFSSGK